MFHESAQARIATPANVVHDGRLSVAAADVRLDANEDPQVPADMVTDVVYAVCMAANIGA